MLGKVKKHILIAFISLVIIYTLFTLYADYNSVLTAFKNYNWLNIPILLLLTFLTHLCRFYRWSYYLKLLKINIRFKESFFIFFSSLVMAFTPGKLGEFAKSYSLKKHEDIPISNSSPIIIAERITEFVSLLIIAALGILIFNYDIYFILALFIFCFALLMIFTNRTFLEFLLSFIGKVKFLKKYVPSILNVVDKSGELLKPVPFIYGLLINAVGWLFEFYAFYLIVHHFNHEFTFLYASFIFSFSIVIGAASMLPGGLGITDGSLGYLLLNFNLSNENAVAITIITRVVTLWFTIILGLFSLIIYTKLFGQIYKK